MGSTGASGMHVEFIDDEPIYDGANLVVRFGARVDGKPVECAITAEALERSGATAVTLHSGFVRMIELQEQRQ
jgi:hypothetical protein